VEDFAAFMRAAAERYSGRHSGLPRVRYWRIWSEPNISVYFRPQFDPTTKKFTSPEIYRNMVNRSAAEIHAVNKDNVVIAGGTAPFRDIDPEVVALDKDWGPLKFMRRLLCIDNAGRPICANRTSFDIWSTHPYTSGGPTHHAELPYDVSLGDLPEMHSAAGCCGSGWPCRFYTAGSFLGDRVRLGLEQARSVRGPDGSPEALGAGGAVSNVGERHRPCQLVPTHG